MIRIGMTLISKKHKPNRKKREHPAALFSTRPFYATRLGAAYVGDALDLIKQLPARSVNAIITSPPYALHASSDFQSVSHFLELATARGVYLS